MDSAAMAEAAELRIMMRHFGLIDFAGLRIPSELQFRAGFAVNQIQTPTTKRWIDFLRRQDLNHRNVEIERAKQIEPLLVRDGRHHEIGDQNRLSGTAESSQMFSQRCTDLKPSGGSD